LQRIEEATEEVRAEPSSGPLWGRLGEIYDIHRLGEQARACYERAEALDPEEWRWPYFAGLVLRENDQQAALARFERAVELNPDYAPLRFYIGMSYLLAERLDDAAVQFERAIELDPGLANALIGRARVEIGRGQPEAALAWLERAASVAPQEAAVHHNLALAYRALGQNDRAEQEQALAAASPVPMQLANLGSLEDPVREETILREGASSLWLLHNARRLRAQGSPGAALEMLDRALSADPRSVGALLESARVLLDRGEAEQARQRVARALEVDPSSAESYAEMGNVLARAGQIDGAIAALGRAIEIDPLLADAQNNLATLLFGVGRADEGLARLSDAAAALPSNADVQYNLAAALLNRERYDEAIEVLRSARKLRPDHVPTLYLLGSTLAMRGRFDEAVDLFRQVVERAPAHLDARLDLGQALWELGRYGEAVAALRESHAAAPNEPAVTFRFAWALATCPADDARSGSEALTLAKGLNEQTQFGDPRLLDLLAAAQAETGDFGAAGATVRRAIQILERMLVAAPPQGADDAAAAEAFAAELRDRAALYREGRAFRDR